MKIDSVSGLSQNISASGNDTKVQSTESTGAVGKGIKNMERSHKEQDGDLQNVNDDMLEKAVEQANKSLAMYDKKIERVVHDVTKTVMYTVKDTKTDEVIREFPPRKIQDMIAKMWELAGLFVDKKA